MSCRNLPCYYCEVEREESYSKGGARFSSSATDYGKCKTHFPKNSKQTESYGECLYCLHEKEKSDNNMHSSEIKGYFDCKKHNPKLHSLHGIFNRTLNGSLDGIFNMPLHGSLNGSSHGKFKFH